MLAKGPRRFAATWGDRFPCLDDRTGTTGFDRHYVFHPAWAARILAQTRPVEHVDISSALIFPVLVSAFIPVKFYDYRPADLQLNNLTSEHADLLALPFPDGSIPSLSCMHVVEHVGLGRYGDPPDPDGDLKAIAELKRVVARGGGASVCGAGGQATDHVQCPPCLFLRSGGRIVSGLRACPVRLDP